MSEVLFILTVIFGAYVFCVVTTSSKKSTNKSTIVTEPEKPVAAVSMDSSAHKPVSKTAPLKTTGTELVTDSDKKTSTKKGLKNPISGEIATSYANYRFTKRWIKDALVSEGLLEKVYKNNELNAETEAAIKAAIAKLEAMEQYRV
jgi:hypothetical protein